MTTSVEAEARQLLLWIEDRKNTIQAKDKAREKQLQLATISTNHAQDLRARADRKDQEAIEHRRNAKLREAEVAAVEEELKAADAKWIEAVKEPEVAEIYDRVWKEFRAQRQREAFQRLKDSRVQYVSCDCDDQGGWGDFHP